MCKSIEWHDILHRLSGKQLECYALHQADFDCFYSLRQQVLPMRSNGSKSGVHGLLRGWIKQDVQLYVFMSCADWFE
jgi:hypothetical protein